MYTVLLKFTFKDEALVDLDLTGDVVSGFYQNGQLAEYFHYASTKDNTITYSAVCVQPASLDTFKYRSLRLAF
jgi:hypothetical protein